MNVFLARQGWMICRYWSYAYGMSAREKKKPASEASMSLKGVDLGELNEVWRRGGEHNLPLRLVLVAKLIDRYIDGLLAEKAGLSIPEWRVVAQLSILEHGTVRRMARQACVDPAEVSRAAAGLEKRGFLKREDNLNDRRSPQFSLTKEGRVHFLKFHPHWQKFSRALLANVDAADTAALNRGLTQFARALLTLLEQRQSVR